MDIQHVIQTFVVNRERSVTSVLPLDCSLLAKTYKNNVKICFYFEKPIANMRNYFHLNTPSCFLVIQTVITHDKRGQQEQQLLREQQVVYFYSFLIEHK